MVSLSWLTHNRPSGIFRRWREKNDRVTKSLKSTEEELSKMKSKVSRLQRITDDKRLEHKEDLSRRLDQAEADLADKNRRIEVSVTNTELTPRIV